MSEQKENEFAPREIGRQRVQLLSTDEAFYDAEVRVEYVPLSGGINTDPKVIRFEKRKRRG